MTLLEKSEHKFPHLSDSVSVNRLSVTPPDTQQQQTERHAERHLHYICKTEGSQKPHYPESKNQP